MAWKRQDVLLLIASLAVCQVCILAQPLQPNGDQPMSVPFGALPIADDSLAPWDSLYPNSEIITEDVCEFDNIGKANGVAVHSIHVPTTTTHMFMELPNGGHPIINDGKAGVLVDIADQTNWKPLETNESVFCGGHTYTKDGLVVTVGGHVDDPITTGLNGYVIFKDGLTGVRVMDARVSNELNRTTNMTYSRWYPSASLLSDGRVMIAGGVESGGNGYDGVKFVELFDPENPDISPLPAYELDPDHIAAFDGKPFYPYFWTLPTGHVFMLADNNSCIFNHHTGQCLREDDPENPGQTRLVSQKPRPGGWASNYPFTASAVMTALIPDGQNRVNKVDIVVFGGSRKSDHPEFLPAWKKFNVDALASRWSHRFTISWSRASPDADWEYTFSDWVQEDMGYPRVMPDATLLPNGDVVILNGAQTGVAGYPVEGQSLSNHPAFWASLYQTSRPANSRFTLLCGTQLPRLYHASAGLTINGTVLVTGADRNRNILPSAQPWFNGTDGKAGPVYDMEIFKPPYVYDTKFQPYILSVNSAERDAIPELGYNELFTIQFEAADTTVGTVNVTTAVLVAPSSTTHSTNFNQRVVQLRVNTRSEGEWEVVTPLDPFHAPPQYYMLFLNNVKTYSSAVWVKLVDKDGAGKEPPKP